MKQYLILSVINHGFVYLLVMVRKSISAPLDESSSKAAASGVGDMVDGVDAAECVPLYSVVLVNTGVDIQCLSGSPITKRKSSHIFSSVNERNQTFLAFSCVYLLATIVCHRCWYCIRCQRCDVCASVFRWDDTAALERTWRPPVAFSYPKCRHLLYPSFCPILLPLFLNTWRCAPGLFYTTASNQYKHTVCDFPHPSKKKTLQYF